MDAKGYYKSLGVSENATQDDIKKAFRKLSLKYHPDKQTNKSDSEKKAAEQKFKEINEAYQVLSDEEKKKNYDTTGDPNNANAFGDFGGFGAGGFEDMFSSFFGGGRTRSPFGNMAREPEPGSDIRMKVPLTIEEVYSGCTKKVKFKRNVRCVNCHGTGGSGKKVCDHCGGTGKAYKKMFTPMGYVESSTTCPHCNGTGFTVQNVCPTCHGKGFKEDETVVEITFPAGMMQEFAIKFDGKGNESSDTRGRNGDFYAYATYKFDVDENTGKPKYTIHNGDVIEIVHLPYYDMLLGCEYTHTFPDKSVKKLNIKSCTKDGAMLRLSNMGIKMGNSCGDYYLEVHYKMPDKLTDPERKLLEGIKVHHYNLENNINTEK